MNRSTFEITTSIGSVLIFVLLCIVADSIHAGGVGFTISFVVFILLISAAGMKLADYGDER